MPDANTQSQAFIFLGGLVAAAVMANQVFSAIVSFRKLKGVDPADDKRYATKDELETLRSEVGGIKNEVTSLSKTITNEFSSLNRSIGVLEGMLKLISDKNN